MPAMPSLRHGAGHVIVFIFMCTSVSFGHKSRKRNSHDTSFNDRYKGLLTELSASNEGASELADSIQGVFGMAPITNVSKPLPPAAASQAATHVESANHTDKLPLKGKVGHINVSAVRTASQTHLTLSAQSRKAENTTKENKTKVIEEAVVSLPMASFALDSPAPTANKTEHKFPGNATQKAAWEEKEKSLEKEVEHLKARLVNVSKTLQSTKKAAVQTPPKLSAKFMAVKNTEPKPKEEKPSLPPKVKSDASEKPLPQPASVQMQKENEVVKPVAQPQVKKVESVLAVETAVEHQMVHAEESEAQTHQAQATSPAPQGWVSSFFSWLTDYWSSPSAVKESVPVTPHASTPLKKKSLVWVKQDPARTAQATLEENLHTIQVNDAWADMEKEDNEKEDLVHREDVAERQRAETPEDARTPTKEELRHRHGVEMSGFWSKLEKEDSGIEQTVQSDDLVKYAELTEQQDSQVAKASAQLGSVNSDRLHRAPKHDGDARMVAIHEPWLRREIRDRKIEREIHSSPDLQMLQLEHRHRRK